MSAYETAYRGARERIRGLVSDRNDATDRVAPATPEWTIHDIVAHLAGITTDIVTGTMDGVGTDEWTARHVHDRLDRTMAELLQEWDEHGSAVEAMVDNFGEAGGQLVTDVVTHEHDIRGALGLAGARDSEGVNVACNWIGTRIGEALDQATAGSWHVEHDAGACTFGSGEPVGTLRATRFEIVRAATGRRSREQVAAYAWEGDARQDLLVLGPFTPRASALAE